MEISSNGSLDWTLVDGVLEIINGNLQDSNNGVFARQLNVFNGISSSTYTISWKNLYCYSIRYCFLCWKCVTNTLKILMYMEHILLRFLANSTNTDLRIYGYTMEG